MFTFLLIWKNRWKENEVFRWNQGNSALEILHKCEKFMGTIALSNPLSNCGLYVLKLLEYGC